MHPAWAWHIVGASKVAVGLPELEVGVEVRGGPAGEDSL